MVQALLPIARKYSWLYGVDPNTKVLLKVWECQRKVLFEGERPFCGYSGGYQDISCLLVSRNSTAYIGSGAGDIIVAGLNMLWAEFIIVGAGFGALLAIFFERGLSYLEYKFTPPGFTVTK